MAVALKNHRFFFHGLKMYKWFGHYCQIIVVFITFYSL